MAAEIFRSAANWRPPGIARAIIRDKRLMKGRTVITIAHRLSTISDTNNIIVLKGGVVAETGTRQQLLTFNGIYAGLHRIQYQEPSA
jgi:ABC-type multidrug transport system fused ATPase/permease subunit